MTEHQFKPGDVVQLKSGDPVMTVASLTVSDGSRATLFARHKFLSRP